MHKASIARNPVCNMNIEKCTILLLVIAASVSNTVGDAVSRCPLHLKRSRYLKAAPEWNMCYNFHTEERTFKTARATCYREKGEMVIIKEEKIQRFLLKSLTDLSWPRNALWIGASDRQTEMNWKWVTGESVNSGYKNWASGQPSCGLFCMEDCAIMRWREWGGKWHDKHCSAFEDYSFVCQFDMLPPPIKPTTTTTTTTTTTKLPSTTEIKNATVNEAIIHISSGDANNSKMLLSDYLLHGKGLGTKEETTTDESISALSKVEGMQGSKGAHQPIVLDQDTPALSTGAVTGLVLGIIIGLSVGVCLMMFLLVTRRRRKKELREEDLSMRYENPYYGEVRSDNGNTETNNDNDDGDDDICCSRLNDQVEGACGGQSPEMTKKLLLPPAHSDAAKNRSLRNLLPPSSSLHVRPKCIMNQYECPPTLDTSKLLHHEASAQMKNHPNLPTEDSDTEENYYDEVGPQSKLFVGTAYDVPTSNKSRVPKAESLPSFDGASVSDLPLYSNEENMYESMEHLRGELGYLQIDQDEEARQSINDDEGSSLENEDKGNLYVQFPIDKSS